MTFLFLDDIREPSKFQHLIFEEGYIVWVKNYNEFVNHINQNGLPNAISFDNDLGEELEGYDCAKFLVNFCMDNNLKLPKFKVHSANPVAKVNIETLLNNFKKYCE